jgi:large subunit ribosomal protein L21
MYAIVEIAGQQFKVEQNDEIFVHRLEGEPGKKIEFDQVLLLDNDGKISIGKPLLEGTSITGQIVDHVRGDKVVVFKKKRRKGYEKESGHRQDFTRVMIENINHAGSSKHRKAKEKAAEPAATAAAEPAEE